MVWINLTAEKWKKYCRPIYSLARKLISGAHTTHRMVTKLSVGCWWSNLIALKSSMPFLINGSIQILSEYAFIDEYEKSYHSIIIKKLLNTNYRTFFDELLIMYDKYLWKYNKCLILHYKDFCHCKSNFH